MLFKILLPLLLLFSNVYSFNKLKVLVSIEPYQYLVERIGKRKVNVKSLYKDSKIINNHSQYELRKLAKHHLYLQAGLNGEKEFYNIFLKFNKKIRTGDLDFNIKKINNNNQINEFIWLDPLNLRMISNNILYELIKIDPKNKKYYKNNYEILIKEIDTLYLRIKSLYTKSQKYNAYVFDQRWAYFAKRFDLSFYERNKSLIKASELSKVIQFTLDHNVVLCLSSPGFDYYILSSLVNTTNTKLIEHDIYKYSLLSNLYSLSVLLFKKN